MREMQKPLSTQKSTRRTNSESPPKKKYQNCEKCEATKEIARDNIQLKEEIDVLYARITVDERDRRKMEAVQKEFETLKQACNQYRDEYERVLKKLRFKEKIMFELETITQQQIEELDTRNEELEQLKKRFSDEDVLKL